MKNPYTPRIVVEQRNKRFAIFVMMPDGRRHNVGDVYYDEIPVAIRFAARAFNMGMTAHAEIINHCQIRELDVFYVDDIIRMTLAAYEEKKNDQHVQM